MIDIEKYVVEKALIYGAISSGIRCSFVFVPAALNRDGRSVSWLLSGRRSTIDQVRLNRVWRND